MVFGLFVGRDKGRTVTLVAPDLDNAQTMVDASTELSRIGSVQVPDKYRLEAQGVFNPETFLVMYTPD